MLDSRNYTYDVVSVQTSKELTKSGIQDRWESDYRKHLAGEESREGRLGGRPAPSEFANNMYGPDGVSITEETALKLAKEGVGARTLQQYRRQEGRSFTLEKDLVKRDGMLVSKLVARHQPIFPQSSRGSGMRQARDPGEPSLGC